MTIMGVDTPSWQACGKNRACEQQVLPRVQGRIQEDTQKCKTLLLKNVDQKPNVPGCFNTLMAFNGNLNFKT